MKLAAIYARVSSDQQREEHTIASQTAALIEFAKNHELEVPKEWILEDEGYSGATLERPGLERIRDLAAEGQIQVVPGLRARSVESQMHLPDPAHRGVGSTRGGEALREGTPERHRGRSAARTVAGHDRRVRTSADP